MNKLMFEAAHLLCHEFISSQKEDILTTLEPMQRLREFLTLRICLPRRSGNTTLAVQLLKDWETAALIVPREENIRELELTDDLKKRSFTIQQCHKLRGCGIRISIIITDLTSWWEHSDINNLYESILPLNPDVVVSLG